MPKQECCTVCHTPRSNPEDWDDYYQLCPACSYDKYAADDAADFSRTVEDAKDIVDELNDMCDMEARKQFGLSTARYALELMVKAHREHTSPAGLDTVRDRVACLAAGLAKMIVLDAPEPVVAHQLKVLRFAVHELAKHKNAAADI
ncbi:hypothetical protein EBZ80_23540 [bacterium]|nr:hypothetical protein [bacterium]